jgi:type IV pilus assembly protein PilN
MIRINLLAVERQRSKKKLALPVGQKLILGCSLILVGAVAFMGWRYWALGREADKINKDIQAAQRETARLQSIIQQVRQFEQRKAQLQERVALIEELRKGQTGPVHMLDQISRAMPAFLWLNELKQTGNDIVMDGSCTNLNGLSDFVANLEASGYFKRPVEIVGTTAEALPATAQQQGELIKFNIRAQFQVPGAPPPPAVPASTRTGG